MTTRNDQNFLEAMHHRRTISLSLACVLGACSTLPTSGPTGPQVVSSAQDSRSDIKIVEVTDTSALPPPPPSGKWTFPDLAPPPTDMVGAGDIISIFIYEAGIPLFGGGTVQSGSGFDPSVKVENLPPSRVDDNGDIVVPYAGRLHVANKTLIEIQEMIRTSLRGLSQNPQVLVTLQQAINNSVIIGGEVGQPGRLVLNTNRERLSDVIALAGGYRGNAKDLLLRIRRGTGVAELRLSEVLVNPDVDAVAYPGDRLTLIQDPLLFSVLGATGHVQQMPFSRGTMSLAEGIAAAGGPSESRGDPEALFVFRYEKDEAGTVEPVVYHFNMMNTGSYFLAQQFALQDKDILYFGNAEANQPSKVIQLISLLFSPIVAATSAANYLNN